MHLIPSLRGHGRRRAIDKVAELESENRTLFTRQMAADDFFALLTQDRAETHAAWRQEKTRRETTERELEQAENTIRLRDQQIADLQRKLDIAVKAEHVIAKTQEMDGNEIRRLCVMTLPDAAVAGLLGPVTDPGKVR